MKTVSELKVKLFGDGADKSTILELYKNPLIKGFTTNPTLMRKAGIKNYETFAKDILEAVPNRPFSFEVFADEFDEMKRQAHLIASWGENVYVKIPITNTRQDEACSLIQNLSSEGIKVNVTAMTTIRQVEQACLALENGVSAYVSVFAGRIADTGRDPMWVMRAAALCASRYSNIELIWASPRELLNVFQADEAGVHIITATNDILKKLSLVGKDLTGYSLETVQMFFNDAKASGFTL